MDHEKSSTAHNRHEWVCRTEEGLIGEIVKTESLSPDQVKSSEELSAEAEKICPHGQLVCSICNNTYTLQENLIPKGKKNKPINFKELNRRLMVTGKNKNVRRGQNR